MAKHNLVIVESPAKARTLARMLGRGYEIKASLGHVRDLPKSRIGVDVDHDFAPKYVVSRDKAKTVKELKDAARDAKAVYLATDPDREGEAIAWHLSEVIDGDKTDFKRVTFHEITKDAIEEAFKRAHTIDMCLVNAQQARRIVDRLVGYKLSPLLWSKVQRGLSAGRVQSVAVKMVVDREREIQKFVPVEYWNIAAELLKSGTAKPVFRAAFVGLSDGKKLPVGDQKTADAIKANLEKAAYSVLKVATKQAKRSPAPPFITSTLQQESYRRFKFSAKRTMALAQQLYEGLPVGDEGSVGLITYMRTDSTHVAPQALEETREYISGKYGTQYLPAKPRVFAGRVKGAQEAHEAIRPTRIMRAPQDIKGYLTPDLNKLYQLIWQRMVASQMAEAVFDNTTVDVEAKAARTGYLLRTQSSVNVFPGFITLYTEQKDEEDEENKKAGALPRLEKGDVLKLVPPVEAEQQFTKPPPRYTEATLIKALEQNGIGRPSTYAPILATVQEREYVKKTAGAFEPTEVGFTVTDLLVQYFGGIINEKYTAELEDELDKVADDKVGWVKVVRDAYEPLKRSVEVADAALEKTKPAAEPTGEMCPECGAPLVKKVGRFGPFVACSNYPKCKYKPPVQVTENVTEVDCPQCGVAKLVDKTGRFGPYVMCPACGFKESKLPKAQKIMTGVPCPDCPERGELVGRVNKKGKVFYGCSAYPKHKFIVNAKPVKEKCPQCGKLMVEADKGVRCTECKYRNEPAE
jgi:DNA topoisomerase I